MKIIVEQDGDLSPYKNDCNEYMYDGSGFGDGFGVRDKSETYMDYDPSDIYITVDYELNL